MLLLSCLIKDVKNVLKMSHTGWPHVLADSSNDYYVNYIVYIYIIYLYVSILYSTYVYLY